MLSILVSTRCKFTPSLQDLAKPDIARSAAASAVEVLRSYRMLAGCTSQTLLAVRKDFTTGGMQSFQGF